jgi:hypothetical protein
MLSSLPQTRIRYPRQSSFGGILVCSADRRGAFAYVFDNVAHHDWGLPNRLIRQEALTGMGFWGLRSL